MKIVEKMPYEKAELEVIQWLDSKNIPDEKREQEQIESLVKAVQHGIIIFEENGGISQKLKSPIEFEDNKDLTVSELKFKTRLTWKHVKPYMKGVKMDDGFGILHAHICGLTGKGTSIVDSMEMSDLSLSRNIAGFFLQ